MKPRIVVVGVVAIALAASSADARLFGRRNRGGGDDGGSQCGPGGCPGTSPGIAPGFQPLTPLAGGGGQYPQRMVQVQAPGVSVDVGAPMANVVAAPTPPSVMVVSPAAAVVTPQATAAASDEAAMAQLTASLVAADAQLTALKARAAAPVAAKLPVTIAADPRLDALESLTRAIAKKLDVPIETPSESGMREVVDKLPTATLTVAYPDHEEKAQVNFAAYLRRELGSSDE